MSATPLPSIAKRSKNPYFVNNTDLQAHLLDYHNKLKLSIENGTPEPIPSDTIGKAILLICNNLAKRFNFFAYTYKDEMIDEAVIHCVAAIKKFDPYKYDKPFGYFTRIAWRAFLKIITKEGAHTTLKRDMMKRQTDFFTIGEQDKFNDYSAINSNDILEFLEG